LSIIPKLIMNTTNLSLNNDLKTLNDDFLNKSTLANWRTHHQNENYPSFINKSEINENGNFVLVPESTAWFGEFHRGPFFYKEVEGDFTVVTKLKVTGKNSLSPNVKYSLAGIMLRTPRPKEVDKNAKGFENWMFLSTGCATKKGKPQFESKNTVKGKSKLKVFLSKQEWVLIAISRIENTFYQSYKYENDKNWTLLRVINRTDMSKKIQAGMLAYTDFWSVAFKYMFNRKKYNTKAIKGKPDLIASFKYVHFYRLKNNSNTIQYKSEFPQTKMTKTEMETLRLE